MTIAEMCGLLFKFAPISQAKFLYIYDDLSPSDNFKDVALQKWRPEFFLRSDHMEF
jgi:hypothetical protein